MSLKNIRVINKNNKGFSITIITLFLVTFIIYNIIHEDNFNKSVRVYDSGLQITIAEAVRGAAMAAEKNSVAMGKPIINEEVAHDTFRNILNKRTHGGKINRYTLLIYNYGYGGNGKVITYDFDGESIIKGEKELIEDNGQTFYIEGERLSLDGGEIEVHFETSGCMAIAELESDRYIVDRSESGLRWASAEMVISKDFY